MKTKEKKEIFLNIGDQFYCLYGGLLEVQAVNRETGQVTCQYFDSFSEEYKQNQKAKIQKIVEYV